MGCVAPWRWCEGPYPLALAKLPAELSEPGAQLDIQILGQRCAATVIAYCPFDAENAAAGVSRE